MFTGLVQAVGRIEQVERVGAGVRLVVHPGALEAQRMGIGDSIAVNGCCLTVTAMRQGRFYADVSQETLARTANLDRCGEVNLELALTLADRLGGHLVSGHVDGVGTVADWVAAGESRRLHVRAPLELAPCLAYKGSVAVDGVSLTINEVHDLPDACEVRINLIPHTLSSTTLGRLSVGQAVNLEVDLLARYAQRMISQLAINRGSIDR